MRPRRRHGRNTLPLGTVSGRAVQRPGPVQRIPVTHGVAPMHFLILALRTPDFDPEVLPSHRAYLDALRLRGLLAAHGPFLDQSGGAYVIRADSLPECGATIRVIARDNQVERRWSRRTDDGAVD
jgi:uncharacterized protein YciI